MTRQSQIPIHTASSTTISRRGFLKFCSLMAATLALPSHYAGRIAQALADGPRLPVVWLAFQDCTGDSMSFLKASQRTDPLQPGVSDPSIIDILLDFISLEYHETLMAPSGANAELSLNNVLQNYPGAYLAVVEGAIPTGAGGAYCTIRGRTALSIAQQVLPGALAVIAAGTCAMDGGLAAAAPNPTGATGVRTAVPGLARYAALPGCPTNVVNLAATIVYLITFNALPPRDSAGRPVFAYEEEIHEECERKTHYEHDRFVLQWGDAGHRQGWCLFKMGCKGPETKHNCATVKWNSATCWPVAAGHGCVGCARPGFWDAFPVYQALEDD